MIRAYNWLLDFDLTQENLGDLTKNQIKMYIKVISSVYIMNNRGLMQIFFWMCFSNTLLLDWAEIDQMGTNSESTVAHFVSSLDFVYIYEYS